MKISTKILALLLCLSMIFGMVVVVNAEEAQSVSGVLYLDSMETTDGLATSYLNKSYFSASTIVPDGFSGSALKTGVIKDIPSKIDSPPRMFNVDATNFSVEVGKRYRISFKAKYTSLEARSENAPVMRAYFSSLSGATFKWLDKSYALKSSSSSKYHGISVAHTLTNEWAEYYQDFLITEIAGTTGGVVNSTLFVDVKQAMLGDSLYIDDIRWEELPFESYSNAPSGSNAVITGTPALGQTLSGSFAYSPASNGSAQQNSIYVWEKSNAENGIYKVVQATTDNTYKLGIKDFGGQWLRLRVVPKSAKGYVGQSVISQAIQIGSNEKIEYFVATDGSDSNLGTIDAPFRNLSAVVSEINKIPYKPAGGIDVNIRGGVYEITDTINITSKASGTDECKITYKAYNGEKVSFIGGKKLDSSKIQKVEDEAVLNNLFDEDAKDNLYMLDLGEQEITMDAVIPWGWSYLWGSKYDLDHDSSTDKTALNPPSRIYMNNVVLEDARWPNKDQSRLLVQAATLSTSETDWTNYNIKSKPVHMSFPDEDNRSAKWNITADDSYVGGAVAHFWSSDQLRLKSAGYDSSRQKYVLETTDPCSTSLESSTYGLEHKIYFGNIFSEIDKPGESYVDRLGKYGKAGVVYFYPVGNVEKSEIIVSTLKKNMLSVSNVSNVVFDGIDFKDTVETPVSISNSNNVVFKNADISNTSQGGINVSNCKNLKITGCNFYSTAVHPVNITGTDADRKDLIPSGIVIENNIFHNTSLMNTNRASRAAVNLTKTVGVQIRHNEFNDLDFGAMDLSNSNDTIFEYNVVKNAEQNTSDAGAIYWGRQISTLGNEIRYNYFENIGSHLICRILGTKEGASSLFIDDGSTAGAYYGNVFYNGGSQRGTSSSNGGEFGDMWGNISITHDPEKIYNYTSDGKYYSSRSGSAYAHRSWKSGDKIPTEFKNANKTALGSNFFTDSGNDYKPSYSSYLYLNNFLGLFGGTSAGTEGLLSSYTKYLWSDKWKEHYKGTNWEAALDHYDEETYYAAREFYDQNKPVEMLKYLSGALRKELSTNIHDNVALGETGMTSRVNHYRNYVGTDGAITAEDKALFVDFDNKDFTLTSEGLAKIQATAHEFKAIPYSEMGLLTSVGGSKPVATINPWIVYGVPAPGSTVTASYNYSDADGDEELGTKVYWYVHNSTYDTYDLILGSEGKTFEITDEYAGKKLKYEVVPYDSTLLRGESVMSQPFFVKTTGVDYSALNNALEVARNLAETAVVGEGEGTYSQENVDAVKNAFISAQTAVISADFNTQDKVNAATKTLNEAIRKFRFSQNITVEYLNIKDILASKEGWVDKNGNALAAQYNEETDSITLAGGEVARYTGEKFKNKLFTFKVRFEDVAGADGLPQINKSETVDTYSIAGSGFKVRSQNASGDVNDKAADPGLLMGFKNGAFELYDKATVSCPNDVFTQFNKDYTVSYGAYDLGGQTRVVLYVDNELAADVICKAEDCVDLEGYLAFRGPDSTTRMIISPAADTVSAPKVVGVYSQLFESSDSLTGVSLASAVTGSSPSFNYEIAENNSRERGTNAIKFTAVKDAASNTRLFNIDKSNFSFESGKKYRLTWWAKGEAAVEGDCPDIRFLFTIDNGKVKWTDEYGAARASTANPEKTPLDLTEEWTRHTMILEVTGVTDNDSNKNDKIVNGALMVEGSSVTAGDVIWIDDIRWEELVAHAVNVNINGDGSVKYGDAILKNGDKLMIKNDRDPMVLNIVSNDALKAPVVTVNGKKAGLNGNNLIFAHVTEDLDVNISFSSTIYAYQNYFEFDTDVIDRTRLTGIYKDATSTNSLLSMGGSSAYLNVSPSVVDSGNGDGSKAMKLSVIDGFKIDSNKKTRIANITVPIERGYTYSVSFKHKGSEGVKATIAYQLKDTTALILPGGTVRNGFKSTSFTPNETTWQTANWEKDVFTIDRFVKKDDNGNWVDAGATSRNISFMFDMTNSTAAIGRYLMLDDLVVNKIPAHKVTVNVGEHGTVTRNYSDSITDEVENGEFYYAASTGTHGNTLKFTVAPDDGYKAVVKVDGAKLEITDNTVSLNVTKDTNLEVTFEPVIVDIPIDIVGGGTTQVRFSKDVNGKPTIYVYSMITAFTGDPTGLKYGIKLWKTEKPEAKLTLVAHDQESTISNPVFAEPKSGQAFVIKAYGADIKETESYTAQPFVGDKEGDAEETPDFVSSAN